VKQCIYLIEENERIAENTYRMVFKGDASAFTAPGQFLNLQLSGLYLRRPFSVSEWEKDKVTIVYKVVGAGTQKMATFKRGREVDVLTGLGNGFDLSKSGSRPLLIGGGAGVPPLMMLCKMLLTQGKQPTVAMGFASAGEVFFQEAFSRLGVQVNVATMDGSMGTKGVVLDACRMDSCTYFYACGPVPMLKAVCDAACSDGQLSLEERMGCGFGACMGCTVMTSSGAKRVCVDGPVFEKGELIW
jgi:dihydroorotate dehydrogenase electron transfer subunit